MLLPLIVDNGDKDKTTKYQGEHRIDEYCSTVLYTNVIGNKKQVGLGKTNGV